MKQKNRLVYVLLALFFGFLGAHCYYAGNRIKALVLFILGVTTLILTFFASLYFGLFCYFVLFIWSAFDAFSREVDSEKMPFLDKMPVFRFGLTLTGFVILPLVAIGCYIGIFLIPALFDSKEKTELVNCIGNLSELGSTYQMYALQNGGRYPNLENPKEFQAVAKTNNHINYLICQSMTRQRYPYLLLGGYREPVNGKLPVAIERIGNHPGFVNVLLADGTVKSLATKERKYLSLAAFFHEDLNRREFEDLKRKLKALDANPLPPTVYSRAHLNAQKAAAQKKTKTAAPVQKKNTKK